jgi:hypothetical protein
MNTNKLDVGSKAMPSLRKSALAHPQIWPLVVFVVAVGALSLTLMPRGDELVSLLHANGQHTEREVKLLEAQVAAGDRTAQALGSLARARMSRGDVDGSIALLRSWIAERPDDINAIKVLVETSRAANRRDSLIDALERLQRHQPSIESERELTDLYATTSTPLAKVQASEPLAHSTDKYSPVAATSEAVGASNIQSSAAPNGSAKKQSTAGLEPKDAKPDAVLEAQKALRLGHRAEALRWAENASIQSLGASAGTACACV